ncbi:hypothetical protein [Oryza sativa Japonica Group]|uniref:Uncharacterized protein n=1 Tax=Oryza sativa subsp. japonica TaxID=39947 RepID=Q5VQP9_ORYSJ|nr:hypothetical protein [Oryza sativa Japonica Group]
MLHFQEIPKKATPAKDHSWPFEWMNSRTTATEASAESKTLEFRSFHSYQETRSTKESKPLWRCSGKQALRMTTNPGASCHEGEREGSPARRGHHTEPDLPSEHAIDEDVVHRLKLLSAKEESRVAIDTTLLEKIGGTAALLKCKLKEELAFSRAIRVSE